MATESLRNGKKPRVGLFVDVQNIYLSIREVFGEGARLNFAKLIERASSQGEVVFSGAYTSLGNLNNGEHKFLIALKKLRYTDVVARPVKQLPNGELKGNADTEMAFCIGQAVIRHRLQKVILVTGDYDFYPVVERLQQQGIEVEVICPEQRTAWELIVAACRFHNVGELGLVDGTSGKPSTQAA